MPSFKLIVTASLLGLSVVFGASGAASLPPPTQVAASGSLEVAFSPGQGATASVVKAIAEAKQTILVGAYSFSSQAIVQALSRARARGVNVQILLDKSQVSHSYSSASYLVKHGFEVRIDSRHAIYHNKIMIVDNKTVITGSFNFTQAAEASNAENVLIIRNNPALAKVYTQAWLATWQPAIAATEFNLADKPQRKMHDNF